MRRASANDTGMGALAIMGGIAPLSMAQSTPARSLTTESTEDDRGHRDWRPCRSRWSSTTSTSMDDGWIPAVLAAKGTPSMPLCVLVVLCALSGYSYPFTRKLHENREGVRASANDTELGTRHAGAALGAGAP